MRRFETLLDAIASNRGDAIIASLAVTPQLRARVDFTDPYYRAPARFVSRRDAVMSEVRPEYLEGKKIGAIAGSSHEAYLKAMFTDAELHPYPSDEALRLGAAARRGRFHFRRRDLAGVLDQRHRLRRMLRVLRRAVRREPLFRRGHRHRRAQGQRPAAAIAELGAVPALGKRPLHRSVAALFFGQSVLAAPSFRGDAQQRTRNCSTIPGLDAYASSRNDGYTVILHSRGSASFRGPGEPF